MRCARLLTVLVSISLASILLVESSAAGPTRSPAPSPTVSANSSLITIQFVSAGQPFELRFRHADNVISADDVVCPIPVTGAEGVSDRDSVLWPLLAGPGIPVQCSKGPPTVVTFRLNTQYGPLKSDVLWNGSDVIQTVDVTSMLPIGSPSPSPTAPPVTLPETGGRPSGATDGFPDVVPGWLLVLAALITLADLSLNRR